MTKNNTPLETEILIGLLHKYEMEFSPTSVPEETQIFNNFSNATWHIFGSALGMFFCFIMYLTTRKDEGKFVCIIVFGLCIYYLIKSILLNRDKSPQITINHQGIATKGIELIPWNQIEDERIEYKRTGRYGQGRDYHLHIELIEELSNNIVIPLENLNITTQELYNIIKTYRQEFLVNPQSKSVKSRSTEL